MVQISLHDQRWFTDTHDLGIVYYQDIWRCRLVHGNRESHLKKNMQMHNECYVGMRALYTASMTFGTNDVALTIESIRTSIGVD